MMLRVYDYRTGNYRVGLRPEPVLDVVATFRTQVFHYIERYAKLRRVNDTLRSAMSDIRRRAVHLTANSPYHRKALGRVERLITQHEVAQSIADIIGSLRPGQVKCLHLASQAYMLELTTLPRPKHGMLNAGAIVAAIPCDDKIYAMADGVSGRLSEAKYAGLSEELLPANAPWPGLLMDMAKLVLSNGGIVENVVSMH